MFMYKLLIFLLGIFCLFFVPVTKYAIKEHAESKAYVTGWSSKYCYESGRENGNIDKKVYFPSVEACGKPLKNKAQSAK